MTSNLRLDDGEYHAIAEWLGTPYFEHKCGIFVVEGRTFVPIEGDRLLRAVADRVKRIAVETPVNPTHQHAPACPILFGGSCMCDPQPIHPKTGTEPVPLPHAILEPALARIAHLMHSDPTADSAEGRELSLLAQLAELYEKQKYPEFAVKKDAAETSANPCPLPHDHFGACAPLPARPDIRLFIENIKDRKLAHVPPGVIDEVVKAWELYRTTMEAGA